MATTGRDQEFAALDSHPNFAVRFFNPFASRSARRLEILTHFGRITRRMHNKSFTVDGAVTIIGGRNIGNAYFSAHPDVEFTDLDVIGAGPVADEVATEFDQYWNHQLAYPVWTLTRIKPDSGRLEKLRLQLHAITKEAGNSVYSERIRSSRIIEQLALKDFPLQWGASTLLADHPDKLLTSPDDRSTHMGPALRSAITKASSEALIFSPYFVPGKSGVEWLRQLIESGVSVHILTNSLASNDVSLVHAGYAKYRKELLKAGVKLYETKPQNGQSQKRRKHGKLTASRASLHAKTFVLDRKQIFIGSFNLDPRSAVLNTEIGLLLDNPVLASSMGNWFDTQRKDVAYELLLNEKEQLTWIDHQADGDLAYIREPKTGVLKRTVVWFAGLLPIEKQL